MVLHGYCLKYGNIESGCRRAGNGKEAAKRRVWGHFALGCLGSCDIFFEIPRPPFSGLDGGHLLLVFLFLAGSILYFLRADVTAAVGFCCDIQNVRAGTDVVAPLIVLV
jgi:hypothetical protein